MATWKNREPVMRVFRRLPQALVEPLDKELEKAAEDLVQLQKRLAPITDEIQKHPGQLKASVHKYRTPGRPLSWRILADAKDDKGNFFGPHVEFGHLAPDGSHVPPQPFFFPAYRSMKREIQRRLRKAARDAAIAAARPWKP